MRRPPIFTWPLLTALTAVTTLSAVSFCSAQGWRSTRIHEAFHAEDSAAGDLDGDGNVDLVEGPLWYPGPEFATPKELAEPKTFSKFGYSDQFFSRVADVDGDGANDVVVIGFPGAPVRLYLNPGHDQLDQHWPMHEITGGVDNESPVILDLVPGGAPEIVCGHDSEYGYFAAGPDVTQPWSWHPISRGGACPHRFIHSMGVGDVNDDGRLDILDRTFWWEQPEQLQAGQPWRKHVWAEQPYGSGGAQICVGDVDADGDADIVTSMNAHAYGLAWFEQTGEGSFARHDIMGASSTDSPYGVSFSQLHAVDLTDVDGDGALDIVTGRRHLAHGGKDPGGLQPPVLYWFRNERRDGPVEFVPHTIHGDSGVGVDVLVRDLNGDGKVDVVSANKRGLTVHLQQQATASGRAERWEVSEGRDQSTYAEGHSPAEAAENMLVPDGFAVDLIACEPKLTQPIAMCFDARGRLWVVEGHTYPNKAPEGQGADRILILEDADGDGSFESRKVFQEGLNLASGIEVGFGGVFVGAAPELLFIPDRDRDDRPDSEPVVLLDGWGHQDTHETLNSFTWGPDGWLYGCQGVFTHSRVGRPGTPDEQRVPINAGVWRYHPTRKQFEVFAHGTSNPWGVDYNDRGDWFISACVIPHLYHVIQGGRYQRQAGRHFNRYTYDDLKTIADHSHYTGSIREHAFWGENSVTRPPSALDTSLLGGGHAHCGLAIYNGGVFPSGYEGELLFHNLHGHRLVREAVEEDGSGYIGRHRPDFALAQDHHQIGVGVMVGPDGALYTSDWHDPQTCHNRNPEIWDRSNGRIFRIRYGQVRPYRFNLWAESDAELLQRLRSENGFFARQASRLLAERAAEGTLKVDAVAGQLAAWLDAASNTRDRLRALWTMHAVGVLTQSDHERLLGHRDPYVRGWTVQLLGEAAEPLAESTLRRVVELARDENELVVLRYLAALLQRLPLSQRLELASHLAGKRLAETDRNLPLLVWYGLEPLVESQAAAVLELARNSGLPNLHRFVVRRLSESEAGRSSLVRFYAQADRANHWPLLLEELDAAATARAGVEMPAEWPKLRRMLEQADNGRVVQLARSVAVQFGDQSVFPHFRAVLTNRQAPRQQRLDALAALRTAKDPQLGQHLHDVLADPELASSAAAALAEFGNAKTPEVLISRFADFNDKTRTSALSTLVSRKKDARALAAAMETGQIPPSEVPAFIVRQALALEDDKLNTQLEQVWGKINVSSEEMRSQYEKYRKLLTPRSIAGADASRGRALYKANCGNCHKLFGSGGEIGPEITGANRNQRDYWLENILEPNALIGRAYQVTSLLTADGRVISGIIETENDQAVTIQTATEKLVVAQEDIEQRKSSEASLMPAGQLETLTPDQVRDLFKYLMGPSQVPLPKPAES